MKIKYKINNIVNGIVIGTQFKYTGRVWQRDRNTWFRIGKDPHIVSNTEDVSTIDENFKNGDYETVENNDLNLELKNG